MTTEAPIREGQVLTGPLFNEPMQVETVCANGSGVWIAGLVGQRSERFRRAAIDSWIDEETGATGAQTFGNGAKPSNGHEEG